MGMRRHRGFHSDQAIFLIKRGIIAARINKLRSSSTKSGIAENEMTENN